MPSKIEKLQAYAGHLLDGMIYLQERYAVLEPMLSDSEVRRHFGSGGRSRGFEVLRYSLLLSCIQDIANLTFDRSSSTPSVHNIMAELSDGGLRSQMRTEFASWNVGIPAEYADDREVLAALKRMDAKEEEERRVQFDALYADLGARWDALSRSPSLQSFRVVRDKVSAHTEIKYVADKYQPVRIDDLGITRAELCEAVEDLQRVVELVGLIVRNAAFAWDMLDEQLDRASRSFWSSGVSA